MPILPLEIQDYSGFVNTQSRSTAPWCVHARLGHVCATVTCLTECPGLPTSVLVRFPHHPSFPRPALGFALLSLGNAEVHLCSRFCTGMAVPSHPIPWSTRLHTDVLPPYLGCYLRQKQNEHVGYNDSHGQQKSFWCS